MGLYKFEFEKSQPAGAATLGPPSASTGPLKKNGCMTPRIKSSRPLNTRKSWQHFEHLRTAMARTGRYEEEAPHKAGMGGEPPPCEALNYPDARHHDCFQL
jgi:hypothetical protein